MKKYYKVPYKVPDRDNLRMMDSMNALSLGIYEITCDGSKASSLIEAGKYYAVDNLITDENFPIKPHRPQNRKIEIFQPYGLDFWDRISTRSMIERFALCPHPLELPTYEDALTFGKEYPYMQTWYDIVFLHKPVLVNGEKKIIVLIGPVGGHEHFRQVVLRDFEYSWFDCARFAAVYGR